MKHIGENDMRLRDLGESRIVYELIAPRFPLMQADAIGIGDDCAVLPWVGEGENLVVTTDPAPEPIQCLVDSYDYYHYGRLVVLINISDVASMGAKPIGLLLSTVMREDMLVSDYVRFWDGVQDASREWQCPIVGGNIKDGPEFTATGTALGSIKKDRIMTRVGCKEGDRVLVIGAMGLFWAAVLHRLEACGVELSDMEKTLLDTALLRPVARLREGMALAKGGDISACMDSSDGVIGCLHELAKVNKVDIVIDGSSLVPESCVAMIAERAGIDVRKLMLCWGDWQLVCTAPSVRVSHITTLMKEMGTECHDIGAVVSGNSTVWLEEGSQRKRLANFSSERFSNTSVFTHGLNTYVEALKTQPITLD